MRRWVTRVLWYTTGRLRPRQIGRVTSEMAHGMTRPTHVQSLDIFVLIVVCPNTKIHGAHSRYSRFL